MLKPRAPEVNELQEVFQFLDKNLRSQNEWSVIQEYPLAFDPKNTGNIRIIKDENKIISHAVLRTTLIKTPYAIFNVGMIGSVATDPSYRNKGLSSALLEDCLKQAREASCDFVILWTDLFDFYRKFGFELAGSELSLIINNTFAPVKPRTDLRIIKGTQVDPNAIMRLYNLHSVTSVRSIEDIKKFLHIPNSRVYTAWNKNNQLEAYAIEGKGIDLQGYVHEWGGNTSALMQVFKHIQTEQNKEIIVITPPHCKNLIRQGLAAGAQKYEGILGMIKILDTKSVCKKIQRTARRMGISDFAIEMHENNLYFGTSEEVYKTDSELDMVHLLFGPQKLADIHPFSEHTLSKLTKVLPIPLWIWGWDSI